MIKSDMGKRGGGGGGGGGVLVVLGMWSSQSNLYILS